MIAEVCSFYSWTADHALSMPASRFFVMLQSARRLKAQQRVYDCYISRCSNMTKDDFIQTIEWFDSYGVEKEEKPVEVKKTDPLKGEAARVAIMGAFAKSRSIDHTVRK